MYTQKEVLDYGGLSFTDHHARLWDYETGRWNGIDPALQYSSPYAGMGNNPVMYVDEDGEWVITALLTIVGAYLGGVGTNGGELNPGKWDYSSPATYFGIVGGGLLGYVGGYAIVNPAYAPALKLGIALPGAGGGVYLVGTGADWSFQWTTPAGGTGGVPLSKEKRENQVSTEQAVNEAIWEAEALYDIQQKYGDYAVSDATYIAPIIRHDTPAASTHNNVLGNVGTVNSVYNEFSPNVYSQWGGRVLTGYSIYNNAKSENYAGVAWDVVSMSSRLSPYMLVAEGYYTVSQSEYIQMEIGRSAEKEFRHNVAMAKKYQQLGNQKMADRYWDRAIKNERTMERSYKTIRKRR